MTENGEKGKGRERKGRERVRWKTKSAKEVADTLVSSLAYHSSSSLVIHRP